MALTKDVDFIDTLFKRYQNTPIYCDHCKKQIPFKKWVLQFHQHRYFCSKKCRERANFDPGENKFASKTEQAIYVYLTLEYPNSIVRHNIRDFIPPYEIDFSIDDIYIEYCGNFHFSKKGKDNIRKIEKTKLNDKKKKDLICVSNKKKLIRVWAEIGLYSRPKLFNCVLKILKNRICEAMESNNVADCLEICIDKDEKIHIFKN